MMNNNIAVKKFVKENKEFKNQIRKLKIIRFQAKVLDFMIRMSMIIYVAPIIIILCLFAYNRLAGAFIAIAYLFIMSMLLAKFEKDSRVIKFMDDFSETNCKDRIQEIERRIEHNISCSEAARARRELPPAEYAEI